MKEFKHYIERVLNEQKKWIQKAIKKPRALRKKMKKKEGEKLTIKEMDAKKKKLEKGGLTDKELKTVRQINLAKTLKKMKRKK